MSLPDDLLAQAQHLATLDPGRPKQVNLRRATSAAYYALFHLLIAEAAARMASRQPIGLAARIARSINHTEVLSVCKSIVGRTPSLVFRELHAEPSTQELRTVAETFVSVQQARLLADYDTLATQNRSDTLNLIVETAEAFAIWRRIRNSGRSHRLPGSPALRQAVGPLMAGPAISRFESGRISVQHSAILALQALARRVSGLRGRKPLPQHLLTGERGELEALFFLRRLGFAVVERRWRVSELNGDLDLIAWEGETLCFIEVKTRTKRDNTPARSAVDYSKQQMLRRMRRAFLRTLPAALRYTVVTRFDVASVYLLGDEAECELHRGVFEAEEAYSRGTGV